MINFERDDEKTNLKKRPIDELPLYPLDDQYNRTHIDLTSVDLSSSSSPSKVLQPNRINPDKEISFPVVSSQLSPSTAVRWIVTQLFRQNVIHQLPSLKPNKRIRTEGKYGKEINFSNRLNELKEKALKPNTKEAN